MKRSVKQLLVTVFSIVTLGYIASISAHESPRVILDPEGNNPSFLAYASVSCFDDGNGAPDSMVISVQDFSAPQANLLVSAQVIGKFHAAQTTDLVSGDGGYSAEVRVHEGAGPYLLLINKSGHGTREFVLTYHCLTIDGIHTGTNDPMVIQFQ